MNVDFNRQLKGFDGEPLKNGEADLTLKSIAMEVLMAVFPDEKDLKGEDKLKRYLLAGRIHKGEKDFTAEDIAMVKKLIGKAYGPVVVGASWTLLENSEKE